MAQPMTGSSKGCLSRARWLRWVPMRPSISPLNNLHQAWAAAPFAMVQPMTGSSHKGRLFRARCLRWASMRPSIITTAAEYIHSIHGVCPFLAKEEVMQLQWRWSSPQCAHSWQRKK
ncbi:hypothetical protein VPH35_042865 [Triticum aestivum]